MLYYRAICWAVPPFWVCDLVSFDKDIEVFVFSDVFPFWFDLER
jgi:hypothetical protein